MYMYMYMYGCYDPTDSVFAVKSRPPIVAHACVVEYIFSRFTRPAIQTRVVITGIRCSVAPVSSVVVGADAFEAPTTRLHTQTVLAAWTGRTWTVRVNYKRKDICQLNYISFDYIDRC